MSRAVGLLVLLSCAHATPSRQLRDAQGPIDQECRSDIDCGLRVITNQQGEDEFYSYNVAERARAELVGRSVGGRAMELPETRTCVEVAPACVAARCVALLRPTPEKGCLKDTGG